MCWCLHRLCAIGASASGTQASSCSATLTELTRHLHPCVASTAPKTPHACCCMIYQEATIVVIIIPCHSFLTAYSTPSSTARQHLSAACRVAVTDRFLLAADQDQEKVQVQLDYHLCHTEHKSSTWRQALGEKHFRAENIADLVELIYFLWFEARQLSRAACMLAKVCS